MNDCRDQPVGNVQYGQHTGGKDQNQKAKRKAKSFSNLIIRCKGKILVIIVRKRTLDCKILVPVKCQKLPGVITALLQKLRGFEIGDIVRYIQECPLPGGENKFLTGMGRSELNSRVNQTFRIYGNYKITERPQGKIVDFTHIAAEQKIFSAIRAGPGDRTASF